MVRGTAEQSHGERVGVTHAEATNATSPTEQDGSSWAGIVAFLAVVAWTALGALIGLALTMWVIVPSMGAGNVERMAALGRHIDTGVRPDVVLLGTSVTVEGVDAATVADELPGHQIVENWAINGCAINEARLIMPKVLTAHPRYVVLNLLPNDLGEPSDIVLEKAYGYAVGGFASAWPAADPTEAFPGLTEESARALRSGSIAQAIHFRSTPLDWLNREARMVVRSGVRRAPVADWDSPHELTADIGGAQLDRHFDAASEAIASRTATETGAGAAMIRALARTITESGACAVVCFAPQHPGLRERVPGAMDAIRALGAEIEAMPGVVFFDASELLSADEFADAVHPNAAGRDAFSRAVGARIAALELAGGGE